MTTLMAASRQWASRPSDQRFVGLRPLLEKVLDEHRRSRQKLVTSTQLEVQPADADPRQGLQLVGQNGTAATMTNWSFGQLASLAKAPAAYMHVLGKAGLAPLAADCMNAGLKVLRETKDLGLLLTRDSEDGQLVQVRAATGPNYGRIWNHQVVQALIDRFGDGLTGEFRVPGEFRKAVAVTKHNTTIFGGDRSIFVFLADENNLIEVPGGRDGQPDLLARGFFCWNSEVGSDSIGAAFFLYRYVCCNRMVWGAQQYREIRLRHTSGAPDRWLDQIHPVLIEYANSATTPIVAQVKAAQARKLDKAEAFLAKRFTRNFAAQVAQTHIREEGRPIETLWDAVNGITAVARGISHQDDRVTIERQAGKLLDLVAEKV